MLLKKKNYLYYEIFKYYNQFNTNLNELKININDDLIKISEYIIKNI